MSWPAGWRLSVRVDVDPALAKQARIVASRNASHAEKAANVPGLYWVTGPTGARIAKVAIPPRKYHQKDTLILRDAVARAVLEAKAAAGYQGLAEGVVLLSWLAVFQLPKSEERIRNPPERRWKVSRPDRDNVDKPILDALKARVYGEDWQVSIGTQLKVVGAQGEAPHLQLWIQDGTDVPVPQVGALQPSLFTGP